MFSIYVNYTENTYVFFNDPATSEIYSLSLHDALPIFTDADVSVENRLFETLDPTTRGFVHDGREYLLTDTVGFIRRLPTDRKSTRLNSSHANISYAVFCLKKKK